MTTKNRRVMNLRIFLSIGKFYHAKIDRCFREEEKVNVTGGT